MPRFQFRAQKPGAAVAQRAHDDGSTHSVHSKSKSKTPRASKRTKDNPRNLVDDYRSFRKKEREEQKTKTNKNKTSDTANNSSETGDNGDFPSVNRLGEAAPSWVLSPPEAVCSPSNSFSVSKYRDLLVPSLSEDDEAEQELDLHGGEPSPSPSLYPDPSIDMDGIMNESDSSNHHESKSMASPNHGLHLRLFDNDDDIDDEGENYEPTLSCETGASTTIEWITEIDYQPRSGGIQKPSTTIIRSEKDKKNDSEPSCKPEGKEAEPTPTMSTAEATTSDDENKPAEGSKWDGAYSPSFFARFANALFGCDDNDDTDGRFSMKCGGDHREPNTVEAKLKAFTMPSPRKSAKSEIGSPRRDSGPGPSETSLAGEESSEYQSCTETEYTTTEYTSVGVTTLGDTTETSNYPGSLSITTREGDGARTVGYEGDDNATFPTYQRGFSATGETQSEPRNGEVLEFESDPYHEDETLTTYGEAMGVSTLEDTTTFTLGDTTTFTFNDYDDDDDEQREDYDTTNEDSSYGSNSFRSPLTDSYQTASSRFFGDSQSRSFSLRSMPRFREHFPDTRGNGDRDGAQGSVVGNQIAFVSHHHEEQKQPLAMGESRSVSTRSPSSLRESLMSSGFRNENDVIVGIMAIAEDDDNKTGEDSKDSLSYTKSENRNRLINSFILLNENEEAPQSELETSQTTRSRARLRTFGKKGKTKTAIDRDMAVGSECSSCAEDGEKEGCKENEEPTKKTLARKPGEKGPKSPSEADVSSKAVRITVLKTVKKADVDGSRSQGSYRTRSSAFQSIVYGRESTSSGKARDEPRDEPEEPKDSHHQRKANHKVLHRSNGPFLRVDTATVPVSTPEKVPVVSPGGSMASSMHTTSHPKCQGPSSELLLSGNLSPMARLRNPVSYDVLSHD
ncbi:unnamed protein product [Pseudo-nitzschia multistriata]|uniref:Uncharacterized protein n=1 Tax=Pseudo-nitzschia multistriata TaxID=183589 RepID=A0A448YY31_9STRA|nr:unnamed protein product [Pseudo-nitzschia multistriata]